MRESAKKSFKPLKSQLSTSFQAYDYDFQFKPFQHNNIYQTVLCAKFRAKQATFELHYARKCQKLLKTLKIATYHVIPSICQ